MRINPCVLNAARESAIVAYGAMRDAVEFCAKAISDDTSREFLTAALVEDHDTIDKDGTRELVSTMTTTDGRRCHHAILPEHLTSGQYAILSVDKKNAIIARIINPATIFPNYRKVCPGFEGFSLPGAEVRQVEGAELCITPTDIKDSMRNIQLFFHSLPVKVILSIKYLSELPEGTYKTSMVYQFTEGFNGNKAFRFDSADGKKIAVIMPMALD